MVTRGKSDTLRSPLGFRDLYEAFLNKLCRPYGSRQGSARLGALTKQGSPLLRFLWNEAGAHAVRRDSELQRFYRRKLAQKGLGKARVAAARKLGIRLTVRDGRFRDKSELTWRTVFN